MAEYQAYIIDDDGQPTTPIISTNVAFHVGNAKRISQMRYKRWYSINPSAKRSMSKEPIKISLVSLLMGRSP